MKKFAVGIGRTIREIATLHVEAASKEDARRVVEKYLSEDETLEDEGPISVWSDWLAGDAEQGAEIEEITEVE